MASLTRWLLAATVALSAAQPAQGSDVWTALIALSAQMRDVQADIKAHVLKQRNEQKVHLRAELQAQVLDIKTALQEGFNTQLEGQKSHLQEQLVAMQNETTVHLRAELQAQVLDIKTALQEGFNSQVEGQEAHLREQLVAMQNETNVDLRAELQAQVLDIKAALQVVLQSQVQALQEMEQRSKSQLEVQITHLRDQQVSMQTAHKTQLEIMNVVLQEKLTEVQRGQRSKIDAMKTDLQEGLVDQINSTLESMHKKVISLIDEMNTQLKDGIVARLNRTLETMQQKQISHMDEMNIQLEDGLAEKLNSSLEATQQKQKSDLDSVATALEETLLERLKRGRCALLQALAAAGAEGKGANGSEDSALGLALRSGNVDCVGLMLHSEGNATWWDVIARRLVNDTHTSDVVEDVSESVAEIIEREVMQAAQDGRCRLLAALLAAGRDGNRTDDSGNTALGVAAEKGHPTCVSALRTRGAQPLGGARWEEALVKAADSSKPEEVAALLAAGVNPNSTDNDGYTAVFRAVQSGCLQCVRELLARGADKEQRVSGWYNSTALMRASGLGHLEVVRALLSAGAEVDAKDENGDAALHYAALHGHTEVARALLAKGARVGAKGYKDRTALHHAALRGREGVVRLLLASGADASVRDNDGKTALDLARKDGVRRLLSGSGRRR